MLAQGSARDAAGAVREYDSRYPEALSASKRPFFVWRRCCALVSAVRGRPWANGSSRSIRTAPMRPVSDRCSRKHHEKRDLLGLPFSRCLLVAGVAGE